MHNLTPLLFLYYKMQEQIVNTRLISGVNSEQKADVKMEGVCKPLKHPFSDYIHKYGRKNDSLGFCTGTHLTTEAVELSLTVKLV